MQEVAFEQLYATHYRRVRAFCRQLLGSADRAEDATQDAFVSAWRAFDSYDPQKPFIAWMLVIARHRCLDVLRRGGLEHAHLGNEAEQVVAADAGDATGELGALLTAERMQAVNAAIQGLPANQRVPLVLACFGEASYEEIASELGITRTHVGALICRGKQALRRKLATESLS